MAINSIFGTQSNFAANSWLDEFDAEPTPIHTFLDVAFGFVTPMLIFLLVFSFGCRGNVKNLIAVSGSLLFVATAIFRLLCWLLFCDKFQHSRSSIAGTLFIFSLVNFVFSLSVIVCDIILIGFGFYKGITEAGAMLAVLVLPALFCIFASVGFVYLRNGVRAYRSARKKMTRGIFISSFVSSIILTVLVPFVVQDGLLKIVPPMPVKPMVVDKPEASFTIAE